MDRHKDLPAAPNADRRRCAFTLDCAGRRGFRGPVRAARALMAHTVGQWDARGRFMLLSIFLAWYWRLAVSPTPSRQRLCADDRGREAPQVDTRVSQLLRQLGGDARTVTAHYSHGV
jgi:hypothetical protein